jgi:hypothetical protein
MWLLNFANGTIDRRLVVLVYSLGVGALEIFYFGGEDLIAGWIFRRPEVRRG